MQWKQRLHLPNGAFLATSNRRCEMMFEEASHFAVHLRRMEATIKKLQDNAEGKVMFKGKCVSLCDRDDG